MFQRSTSAVCTSTRSPLQHPESGRLHFVAIFHAFSQFCGRDVSPSGPAKAAKGSPQSISDGGGAERGKRGLFPSFLRCGAGRRGVFYSGRRGGWRRRPRPLPTERAAAEDSVNEGNAVFSVRRLETCLPGLSTGEICCRFVNGRNVVFVLTLRSLREWRKNLRSRNVEGFLTNKAPATTMKSRGGV